MRQGRRSARGAGLALIAFGFAPAVVVGCDDSINKGWLVDKPRVLGARVEASEDPERATLRAGEAGTVTWLVTAPHPAPQAWAFATCAPPDGNFPEVRCEGPVLATGRGTSSAPFVAMGVTYPTELPSVLMLAAFCGGGEPALDAQTFTATCSDGSTPLLASATLFADAAGTNRNPTIADDALRVDDQILFPAASGDDPCAAGKTSLRPGIEPHVIYRFVPEQVEAAPTLPDGRESLLLSSFTDVGEFDRQYAAYVPEDPTSMEARVAWETPASEQVPAAGVAAHFTFVLRDGRGGTGFALRSVCVRP